MRVLDLFCGLKGWSKPFEERGHEVVTLDIDPKFDPTMCMDVRDYGAYYGAFDLILASPPCESFSVASIGTHWTGGKRAYEPKTGQAKLGIQVVRSTLRIIKEVRPRWAIIENPRGVLRNLGIIRENEEMRRNRYLRELVDYERDFLGSGAPPYPGAQPLAPITVWYCHYGERHAKPTDLWGLPFPKTFVPKRPCHNRRPGHLQTCCCKDHEAASRGAKTGTQGLKGSAARAEIPRELASTVMYCCESDLKYRLVSA